MTQLSLALEIGHAVAKRASDHADRVVSQWSQTALQAVKTFAGASNGQPFLAEQVREFAAIDAPPDNRAWGRVFLNAKRDGVIVSCGFASAKSSNGSPKVLWRSA